MDLPGRVLATIRAHTMLPPGGRVLVAVSGGPDSVGLLRILMRLAAGGHLVVAGVVHLNHGLRAAADEDERFCRTLAGELGVPIVADRQDVAALARRWKTSLEAAGRRARHELFGRATRLLDVPRVATGHTEDDQAETFLLRLLRGAGTRGLGSIRPVTDRLCRPLLEVRRAAVRAWLEAEGHTFREDESNADPAFLRNRVRRELLPLLEGRFSSGVVGVLAREAALARADEEFLRTAAIDAARSVVLLQDGAGRRPLEAGGPFEGVEGVELDRAALTALPVALSSRVAQLALEVLADGRFVSAAHATGLLALAAGRAGRGRSLPGQEGALAGDRVVLRRHPARPFVNSFEISLSIPGEALLEPQGWLVSAGQPIVGQHGHSVVAEPRGGDLVVQVDAGAVAPPLTVRSRRRGDRFEPPGLGGRSRKLQDYFVDRKVDRWARDSVPLVVDQAGRIVWVIGLGVGDRFRVTSPSQGVLLLKARRLGGPG